MNSLDDQRGPVDRIASGEDLRIVRLVMIHHHVALWIELERRVLNKALMDDMHKSRRQDNEIHVQVKIRSCDLFDFPVPFLLRPFDLAAVQSLGHDSRPPQEFFGRDGPASLAALFV